MAKVKWTKLLPLFSIGLLLVAAYFLYSTLKNVNWDEVFTYMQTLSLPFLSLIISLTILIYIILSLYDYISFKTLLKSPPPLRIISPSAFVSYAFNFNFGAILGGLGFRMRIYSGWGISPKVIPIAALLSVITTWVGYTFMLSLTLIFGDLPASALKFLPSATPWVLGTLGMALIIAYIATSIKKVSIKIKSVRFHVPKIKYALVQVFLSSLQWALAGTILYLLLNHFGTGLPWDHVLFTYFLASIGGVIARIPAGVGVIEAIFLKTLPSAPASTMLAALLCFRAIYFILPLLISIFGYLIIEYVQKSYKKPETNRH